ncbi:MAG: hypothetical protein HC876_22185 [Chloroflexaceae bacterium]|nr:hypothetical protein [Chloroflexaceae bacterium]
MGNSRERQPSYGVVDLSTRTTHLVPYATAEALSTTAFLLDQQLRCPNTQLTISWDNASHHQAAAVREYLAEVKAGKTEEEWSIRWRGFALHDPSPNPLEDIGHQAQTFVRQPWAKLTSFLDVTTAFKQFLAGQVFDFPKLHRYCPDVQVS